MYFKILHAFCLQEYRMEEIRTEGIQQLSNLVYFNTKQVDWLSDGDKTEICTCSNDVVCLDLVSICDTFIDAQEEEGDPFRPIGSETMEEPKNLKPGKRRVSDVIVSIGDCLPYTNDYRIVSSPEKSTGTQGPDSPVSLLYDSVDSGTTKSSTSPDLEAYPSSPTKLLKMLQVDVTDASPMSQENVMSSR
jgi:hypothetical protein